MKVKIGVVGVGYWGPNFLRIFNQLENSKVVYCCDTNKKRLREIASLYPSVKVTSQLNEILTSAEIDALVVASPSDTHVEISAAAIKAKKHVLVEKPMCLTNQDAQELVQSVKKQKLVLMVGHTYEYHPAIIHIKKLLDKEELGQILYIYSSWLNLGRVRKETNALWSLAPHIISILRYLIGELPEKVVAFGQAYLQRNREDVVFINMLFRDRIIANAHMSWLDPKKERTMTIVGSKKMIVFDEFNHEGSIKIYDKGFLRFKNKNGERAFNFSLRPRYGSTHIPNLPSQEPLREECEHFIDCIINHQTPLSDGKSGADVVKVLEAADNSLKKGGVWVKVI